jgi:hypothetical protein
MKDLRASRNSGSISQKPVLDPKTVILRLTGNFPLARGLRTTTIEVRQAFYGS